MRYPKEYVTYLVHFHGDRDYFECHEILEEYWKKTSPGDKQSHWVGFIQLAVALYHQRRGNGKGALKTLQKSLNIFQCKKTETLNLGLNYSMLMQLLAELNERLLQGKPYEHFVFPISDPGLINECEALCLSKGLAWCSASLLHDPFLVNKHSLRDRSEVIEERARILSRKNAGR
ncbi:DUF309 domain-containing protein [Peribacillus sp. B-H-3]|uniref:DUF309 domain-containing protein n=1 Tax=Peribacillus sp. B-H-3 TaxID=3400420 RepID=UPI003B022339